MSGNKHYVALKATVAVLSELFFSFTKFRSRLAAGGLRSKLHPDSFTDH